MGVNASLDIFQNLGKVPQNHVEQNFYRKIFFFTSTTLKEPPSFLWMVQFYRDMWKQHSHTPAPLTDLVGLGKRKLMWNPNHQKSFEEIERVLVK